VSVILSSGDPEFMVVIRSLLCGDFSN